jgi:hypothetical protein
MNASSLLYGAKLKIERADSHIRELEAAIPGFVCGKGYRFILKEEPKPDEIKVTLQFDPIPDIAPVIVGETLYQLRSALDVATVAMARANGAVGITDVYFPFAKDASDLANVGTRKQPGPQRKIKKLSDKARAVINGLKPYPGGNDLLVGLTTLCNADKHIELVPLALMTGNLIRLMPTQESISDAIITGRIGGLLAAKSLNGVLDELLEMNIAEFIVDSNAALKNLNENIQLTGMVCIRNAKAFNGEPVFSTLRQLSCHIGEIINLLERAL